VSFWPASPAVILSGTELPSGLSDCRSYQVLHSFFAAANIAIRQVIEVWLRQF